MGEVLMLGFEMDIDMVISVDNLIAIFFFNKEYVIVISVLVLCKNIYITYEI